MALPRLTGALRSFSNVTKQDDYIGESADLMHKRAKFREHVLQSDLSWKKMVHFVTDNLDKKEQQAVNESLRDLLNAAKQIVGTDHGQEAIESGAVFLFKTFHDTDCVGQEETKAIKQMFGPFPSSSATAACRSTCQIASRLTEKQLEALIQMFEERNGNNRGCFGKNIMFSLDMYDLEHCEELPVNGDADAEKHISLDFSRYLNNHSAAFRNGSVGSSDRRSFEQEEASFLLCEVEKYVMEMLQRNPEGPTAEDLSCTLFEMLASSKSDDELQNEMFELLGPEGFGLIENLLQNRRKIVERSLSWPEDNRLQALQEQCKKFSGDSSKPNYGCQVTILSEQEKLLMKQYRREEKRHARREKRVGDDSDVLGDGLMSFDPKELRMQREQALLNAQVAPVLSRERDYREIIHYPNVYDSHAEAMKSSAFVGGAKLLLPEGIERENNKMYELVQIPATDPMPIGFEEKPIFVKDMDEKVVARRSPSSPFVYSMLKDYKKRDCRPETQFNLEIDTVSTLWIFLLHEGLCGIRHIIFCT